MSNRRHSARHLHNAWRALDLHLDLLLLLLLLLGAERVERVAAAHLRVHRAEWQYRADNWRVVAAREGALNRKAEDGALDLAQRTIALALGAAAAARRRRERAFADLAAELAREAARHALLRASELAWELEDAVAAAEAFDDDLLGAAAHRTADTERQGNAKKLPSLSKLASVSTCCSAGTGRTSLFWCSWIDSGVVLATAPARRAIAVAITLDGSD